MNEKLTIPSDPFWRKASLLDYLKAIRTELEKAIKEAKRKNPGKKVRISLR